jgi:hypothetical protein
MKTQPELEKVMKYIASVKWQFAKTMSAFPHWYTIRNWNPDKEKSFEHFVSFIRANGYANKFGKATYTYFNVEGFSYWTMGAPVEITTVINRAVVVDSKGV